MNLDGSICVKMQMQPSPHYRIKLDQKPEAKRLRCGVLTNVSIPLFQKTKWNTTFSNGCLGSHNDEERSEMRYVMRIARLRNHQNFERTLRFQDMPGSMLGWVSVNPSRPCYYVTWVWIWCCNFDCSIEVYGLTLESTTYILCTVEIGCISGYSKRLTFGKYTLCMLG